MLQGWPVDDVISSPPINCSVCILCLHARQLNAVRSHIEQLLITSSATRKSISHLDALLKVRLGIDLPHMFCGRDYLLCDSMPICFTFNHDNGTWTSEQQMPVHTRHE